MSDFESSRLLETLGVNFSDIFNLEEHQYIDSVNFIRQKIAPLHLKVSTKSRIRVNILISIVNFFRPDSHDRIVSEPISPEKIQHRFDTRILEFLFDFIEASDSA